MKSPTGRIARSEPNMQSIPIRTPEGAAIREALVHHMTKIPTFQNMPLDPERYRK